MAPDNQLDQRWQQMAKGLKSTQWGGQEQEDLGTQQLSGHTHSSFSGDLQQKEGPPGVDMNDESFMFYIGVSSQT